MRLKLSLLTLFISAEAFSANIKYVSQNSSSSGISWSLPSGDLQKAVDEVHKEGGGEVWVSKGVYYPSLGEKRNKSFIMRENVKIYGGFSGVEKSVKERNIAKNKTVLSGNLGNLNSDKDNSYHVVTGADKAELNGFYIEGGNANLIDPSSKLKVSKIPNVFESIKMSEKAKGGGLFNYGVTPVILNCHFENNKAYLGGAIYNAGSKQAILKEETVLKGPRIEGTTFVANSSYLSAEPSSTIFTLPPTLQTTCSTKIQVQKLVALLQT